MSGQATTKSRCTDCGQWTYGNRDLYSPSGRRFHSPDCTLARTCPECGDPKRTFFTLCRRCELRSKRWDALYESARLHHEGQLGCPDGEACSMFEVHEENFRRWKEKRQETA